MIAIVLGFFWCLPAASATTIIAYRTSDFAIIGADSRVNVVGGEPQLACKIEHTRDVAWASADLWKTNGGNSPDFDVGGIADTSIRYSRSFDSAMEDFDARTSRALVQVLMWMEKAYPAQFVGYLGRDDLEVVFVGTIDGEIRMSMRSFKSHRDKEKGITITSQHKDCPGDCDSSGPTTAILGRQQAINAKFRANQNIWTALGSADVIRDLITIQAVATPDTVGPPIAILKVTRKGLVWVDQANCDR